MPSFKYQAATATGQKESGILDAPDQDTLVETLQKKGLTVLKISKWKQKPGTSRAGRIKMHYRISSRDMLQFASQLATTLKANIPLLRSFDIQIQQTTSQKLKVILEDIKSRLNAGQSLRDSLSQHPKVFNQLWLNLVETGETSGQLPQALEHLAGYMSDRVDLDRRIITALIYPSILIGVSILAIYIFTIFIIPVFGGIFQDFNLTLPLITRMVMGVSDFLNNNILLTFIVVAITVISIRYWIKTPAGRKILDSFLLRVPVLGGFILNTYVEQFSSNLAVLLHSGVPILHALDLIARSSKNILIKEAMRNAYQDISDGKSLSGSISRSNIFPPLAVNMCRIGEETGELDTMLGQLNEYYRKEITVFTERLGTIIEPVVILFMGTIIFVLLLAMYLPIFDITLMGSQT